MALTARTTSNAASEIAATRQADQVAFLHRVPFAYDALRLGFLTGFREDCTYQQQQFKALELPVGILDNDFRNPDLERYVERFFEYEPQVGVIGDAYGVEEVDRYVAAAREIHGSYPESDLVIVPKCRAAIHAIPDDLVVGYSRGYADRLAHPRIRDHLVHTRSPNLTKSEVCGESNFLGVYTKLNPVPAVLTEV